MESGSTEDEDDVVGVLVTPSDPEGIIMRFVGVSSSDMLDGK